MSFGTPNVGARNYTGYSYEGKPIVLAKKRGNPSLKEHHKMGYVPEDKKIEAATLYAVLKNYKEVSEITGVSVANIKKWKQEAWFENVVSRVIKEKNDILDQKLTGVIENCAELIQERLTKGDVRVNYKTGETYEVPLDARGLALVMGIVFDKRQLIRGEATSRTETVSFDRRLENLRDTFEKFSKATQIEGEIIDVDVQQEEPQEQEAGQVKAPALLESQEAVVGVPSAS